VLPHPQDFISRPGQRGDSTPLLRAIRRYVAPVYDYVLVTEPLTEAQLASAGWQGRLPVSDSGNQFHYYRLTPDNRILWGGYDAIYYFMAPTTRASIPATWMRWRAGDGQMATDPLIRGRATKLRGRRSE
jgi:glycine/D-amino acid oxidase-like deaminating enzyme